MTTFTLVAGVSFARTPLNEISAKSAEITALGWEERDRGDPWAVSFSKGFPDGEHDDGEDELRAVMGDYWLTADEIGELRKR